MGIVVPEKLRYGITWEFIGEFPGYPASVGQPGAVTYTSDTFALYMFWRHVAGLPAPFSLQPTATPGSTTYTFRTRITESPTRPLGRWEWVIRASNLNYVRVEELAAGVVEVLPSVGTQTDMRGPYRKALDALEGQIAAGMTWDKVSVSYGGRMVTFRSATELRDALGLLKSQVQIEEARREGRALPRDVRVRF